MPTIDLEKHGRIIQIGISAFNAVVLLLGLLWFVAQWHGDARMTGERVNVISGKVEALKEVDQTIVGSIREVQEKTTNRLTALETQNAFILNALNRLEAAVANGRTNNRL